MIKSEQDKYPVVSSFRNLQEITNENFHFNIPIYQRLYVWGNDQIKTLLEDLNKAYKANATRYYLGGVIISKNQNNIYDLIDGQQRFTTLWLIGIVLKYRMYNFNFYHSKEIKKSRLQFSTRDFANDFFNNYDDNAIVQSEKNIEPELIPIYEAIKTIERQMKSIDFKDLNHENFASFIMDHVMIMVSEMPSNVDENKLFEVSNNRGVQLQHHEILKARLLKYIVDVNDRAKYAQLWEACSIMNNYIEKNIKDITGATWKTLTFDSTNEEEKEVGLPRDIFNRLGNNQEIERISLLKLLQSDNIEFGIDTSNNSNSSNQEFDYDSGKVRSIISFPMLLLHTLRIYQFKKNPNLTEEDIVAVDEKKLLLIFENEIKSIGTQAEVKEFIELLWDIRVKFDKHIIKWVEKERNIEIHSIKKLYLNKDALVRKDLGSNDGFALLQSMLYHSQQIITHYWLTPLLLKLLEEDDTEVLYDYLRILDDAMFCSGNTQDLRIRSWNMMKLDISDIKPSIANLEINSHLGTKYPSYVFYKLDFVLWYLRDFVFNDLNIVETKKEDWNTYRMTAKNSVEHISPQNRKENDLNIVWNELDSHEQKTNKLDDFGNLVLLTSSMNSEYSNNIYTTKKSEFLAKANNKRLDSLKSALIFENPIWNWDLCEIHRNQMINYFEIYFKR